MIKLDSQVQCVDASLNSSSISSASTSSLNLNGGGGAAAANADSNNNYLLLKKSTSDDSLLLIDENDAGSSTMGDLYARTNLIVNYLPQNMTQDEIKELFSSIGAVESCKLIKDKLTGQSLGYAFVNYYQQENAEQAVNSFNGMKLQNKTIKVSLARPSSESIKGANLYVCGLPKDFSQSQLERMFCEFGTIISSKILTDPKTGESKGVGFVRFDKRYEAERAIEKLNGKIYENIPDPLVVKFANSPTSVKSVMGIPLAPFVPTVRGFYQPYRSSTNASYRYSPMSGPGTAPSSVSASTAYCHTDSLIHHHHQHHHQSPVAAAVTSLNGLAALTSPALATLAPATTLITTAQTPPQSLSTNSLSSINYSGWPIFVYNLGPESDEGLLWQLFGPFGAVQSVKVVRDVQTHKCKGFGFVTMTNYEEAITAINCLNGLNLQNRILQVSFKTTNKHIF